MFGLRDHAEYADIGTDDVVTSRWGVRAIKLRSAIEAGCHKLDLAPDLADDIGSRRWLRGMGTMVGLCAVAVSMWPDFSAVEAATTGPAAG